MRYIKLQDTIHRVSVFKTLRKVFIRWGLGSLILCMGSTPLIAQLWNVGENGVSSIDWLERSSDGTDIIAGQYSKGASLEDGMLENRGSTDLFLTRATEGVITGPIWTIQSPSADQWRSGYKLDDKIYLTGSFWDTLWVNDELVATTSRGKAGFVLIASEDLSDQPEVLIIEGNGTKEVEGIAANSDQFIVAGEFTDSLFLPGARLYSEAGKKVFVASYSMTGDLQDTLIFGDDANLDINDIEICGHRLFLGGSFFGTFTLAGKTLNTGTPDIDAYTAVCDLALQPIEAHDLGGVFPDEVTCMSCLVDTCIVGGQFIGVMRINDNLSLESKGFEQDVFIGKLYPSGQMGLAANVRSIGGERLNEIKAGPAGIYLAGEHSGVFETAVDTLPDPQGGINGFVLALDRDFTEYYLLGMTSSERSAGQTLYIQADSTFHLGGYYGSDLMIGEEGITSTESFQAYTYAGKATIVKDDPDPPDPDNAFILYPNPFSIELSLISSEPTRQFRLFNTLGQLVFKTTQENPWRMPQLATGIYIYNWEGVNGSTYSGRLIYRSN